MRLQPPHPCRYQPTESPHPALGSLHAAPGTRLSALCRYQPTESPHLRFLIEGAWASLVTPRASGVLVPVLVEELLQLHVAASAEQPPDRHEQAPSRCYPDAIQMLSRCYPDAIQMLSRCYPDAV